MKKFLKKYWLFIFLATLITILSFFYFYQKQTEEKKKLLPLKTPFIKNYNSIKPNLANLEKNFPEFKKEIEVYQVGQNLITEQEALKIAQNFGFQKQPIVTNDTQNTIYSWSENVNNLLVYLQKGVAIYSLDLFNNPNLIQGEPPTINEAEIKFRDFLKEKSFSPTEKINLKLVENYFVKNKGDYFIKTTPNDPQKNLVFLKFIYQLNELQINGLSPIFINVYLGPQSKIVRFEFNKIFEKIDNFEVYPIKNKEEVIQSIKNNPQISFLNNPSSYLEGNILLEEKTPNLQSLSFEKIELIYYKENQSQSYLQPVFLITGKATLKDGQQAEAGLYLPAIKDEYLLK